MIGCDPAIISICTSGVPGFEAFVITGATSGAESFVEFLVCVSFVVAFAFTGAAFLAVLFVELEVFNVPLTFESYFAN